MRKRENSCFFRSPAQERGSILVYVVWMTALLSFFAVSFGTQSAGNLARIARLQNDLESSYLLKSSITYAEVQLALDENPNADGFADLWAQPALFEKIGFSGESYFSIFNILPNAVTGYDERLSGMRDEESRININKAPEEILVNLLTLGGKMEADKALELAQKIEDWIDEDTKKRDFGAENYEYMDLKPSSYDCKDGPLESIEELLLIRDMPAEVYERIKSYVTVYGNGKVNINTASDKVLQVLGISDAGISGIKAYRAGDDGEPNTEDDRVLPNENALAGELQLFMTGEDQILITQLLAKHLLGVQSTAFRFRVEARTHSDAPLAEGEYVLNRSGEILYGQEA